jgi:hypothetical protein
MFRQEAGSSIDIASRLQAGRSRSGGSILGWGEKFFLPHKVQKCSGARPTSYPIVAVDCFSGEKRQGREAGHLSPCSAEVMNGGAISPLPYTPSRYGASLIKPSDIFTF